MFISMAELKESGVKLKMAENSRPLKVGFKKGVLGIPPIYIDDHRLTLFRNMVAYEQCHQSCKPDITMYTFFLNGLINSAKEIELLHCEGVIQHSLGGNKQVAKLINRLCKGVARDVEESYLHKMVWKINCHCNDWLITKRARLKHDILATHGQVFQLWLLCCCFISPYFRLVVDLEMLKSTLKRMVFGCPSRIASLYPFQVYCGHLGQARVPLYGKMDLRIINT
ncbi:hypothetical protein RJ639_047883 [Escallonia herrerae]|uniref:Uncharacterized protein n=1 Tax=Escallonia herrerae TaxID=1293975 RepID=A0AA88W720_9ASTE|nr:hypothetical protein RJ639_047883 [Escallonia herrerae]